MRKWRSVMGMFLLRILLLAVLIQAAFFVLSKTFISETNCETPAKEETSLYTRTKKYSSVSNDRTLNVHVVPHTHDDVGWLKTIDQYYHGWNETIQVASVKKILDSVVEALLENPSRTFVYVEMKFFQMWWREQSQHTQKNVLRLVQDTKQLSFVNGGWCMHDEATTHYMGMIDQTTLGHDFLKQTFGYIPTIGWQLDPFGHSATQASLMTYQMGFDALYFGRIDYQDREKRRATSQCEGLWDANQKQLGRGNSSSSSSSYQKEIDQSIFWGLTGSYRGQYGPPKGVCLDPNCDPDEYTPLMELNTTERMNFVKTFLLSLKQQSDQTQGSHIMITMGEDFRYQKSLVNFANLDVLLETIASVQEDGSIDIPSILGPEYDAVNVFYSSPEYYTRCKYNETVRSRGKHEDCYFLEKDNYSSRELSERHHQANAKATVKKEGVKWSVKRDDFFPYSDCPHCFWTGYFSSRPALKRYERVGSSFLLAIRQIESLVLPDTKSDNNAATPTKISSNLRALTDQSNPHNHTVRDIDDNDELILCGEQNMYELEDAIGILQHHDGVSGTSKQHVAYDYAKRLQAGIHAVLPCTIRKLKQMLLGNENKNHHLADLQYCQLLNETRCDISVNATRNNMGNTTMNEKPLDIYVIVYNSLASERSVVIDLPVGTNGTFLIDSLENEDGSSASETIVQAQPAPFASLYSNPNSSSSHGSESWVVSFLATSLPAVGAKAFRIRKQSSIQGNSQEDSRLLGSLNREINQSLQRVSNGRFSLLVDTHTGDIRRVGSKGEESLSSWGYYTSFDSQKDNDSGSDAEKAQNSGAYVFRPSTPSQELIKLRSKNSSVIQTPLGTEIHTEYEEPWIRTVTKLRTGMPYLEIEYQVGPIPIEDGIGKEVVTRYNTMVENHSVFYTDSNGREFLRRKRNYRPTWNMTVYEPVAGNYYPINTAIYVDEASSTRLSTNVGRKTPAAFAVVTDRSQGGGSIMDGTIELMVHRRTIADDDRGVGEPINETVVGIDPCPPFGNASRIGEGLVIRGKHRILIENNNDECNRKHQRTNFSQYTESSDKLTCGGIGGARLARSLMDESFAEPLVFVGTAPSSEEIPFRAKSFSGIAKPLPLNVMLITKKPMYDYLEPNAYLVRLGHQYGPEEDPDLSLPVDVDLSHLFPGQEITGFQETTLSGNRAIEDWRLERLDWKGSQGGRANEYTGHPTETKTVITLTAMDVRTFIVGLRE